MPPETRAHTSGTHQGVFSLFFPALPCDSFPSANIISGPTAHARDDPILVLQAAFRVENERRARTDLRPWSGHLQPETASDVSQLWKQDTVSGTRASGDRFRNTTWSCKPALSNHLHLLPCPLLAKTTSPSPAVVVVWLRLLQEKKRGNKVGGSSKLPPAAVQRHTCCIAAISPARLHLSLGHGH